MADISRYPGLRHYRGAPTVYVQHLNHGRLAHSGTGQAFWFRPLSAVLSEVPVDDRELPLLVHARTADFQEVTVQATVTFRIAEPALAASRVDFSIHPESGRWRGTPLEQLTGLLTETAQQHVLDLLARAPLAAALANGVGPVRDQMATGLAGDPRLAEMGIEVLGVRVVAVRPTAEMEKALQTPTREQVQQEADRATYERRALAVERERTISENELQSQIELARREEQLVAQRGANARRQAEEQAAASAIETEAQAAKELRLSAVRADGTRTLGEAKAAAEAAHVAAYRDLADGVVIGLALKDLAANLPQIHSLVLTPDLLAPVLSRLAAPAAQPAEAQAPRRK
jgi:regulator of protease activity HflC (stomatin/prohibitin superfamily)